MPEVVPQTRWRRVAIGDVVRLSTERSRSPRADGFERYVGLEHLEPGDLRIRRWGHVAAGTTFVNVFRPGQVLFGKRRAYQRKVAVADFSGVCSGDIYVLEPKNEQLLPDLLPFICQTDAFFEHAIRTSAGSLSPRTNWKSLATYEFELPPIEEQRRIYTILSASKKLLGTLDHGISCLGMLIASFRKETFDPARLTPVQLSHLCEEGGIQIGPFGAQLHQYDYVRDGIPVIMPVNMMGDRINTQHIACVSEAKARSLAAHRVVEGDILLPRRGDLDRRAYVEPTQAGWLCGTGSIRVRLKKHVPAKAVFHALASHHVVSWLIGNAVGTTMANLSTGIVARIPISLPPLGELGRILMIFSDLEDGLESFRKRQDDAQKIHKAIVATALGVS
jgi:type I restriction enzyme S subunit